MDTTNQYTGHETLGNIYLHEDHIGTQLTGNLGIIETDNTSHGTMPRSFNEDNIGIVMDMLHGRMDMLDLFVKVNFSIDILSSISRGNNDG